MGEVMPTGPVVLDTPEEIAWFQFLTAFSALWVEAETGAKTKGFSAVRFFGKHGFKSKRLKPLLSEVRMYLREQSAEGKIPKVVFAAVRNSVA